MEGCCGGYSQDKERGNILVNSFRLGIVGHAKEKFTEITESIARQSIRDLIFKHNATVVVSGHSPMGGVDIWAEEAALDLGIPMDIRTPLQNKWDAEYGFKQRNLDIAKSSDLVAVIVVKELPEGFKGMRFSGCYHCGSRNPVHVKSGGCWTAWKCPKREWVII